MASGLHQGWSGDGSSDVREGNVVHPGDEVSVMGGIRWSASEEL